MPPLIEVAGGCTCDDAPAVAVDDVEPTFRRLKVEINHYQCDE